MALPLCRRSRACAHIANGHFLEASAMSAPPSLGCSLFSTPSPANLAIRSYPVIAGWSKLTLLGISPTAVSVGFLAGTPITRSCLPCLRSVCPLYISFCLSFPRRWRFILSLIRRAQFSNSRLTLLYFTPPRFKFLLPQASAPVA